MKQILIVGRPQVGKTLFLINFAAFMGQRQINLTVEQPDWSVRTITLSLEEARARLVGTTPHTTRAVQSILLPVAKGKSRVQVEVFDTPGLIDTISGDPAIRRAMAQAIRRIKDSHMVLHVIDATRITREDPDVASVDQEVARFGLSRGGYLIVVNKLDLPGTENAVQKARALFPGHLVVGVSALQQSGLKEVSQVVRRHV